MNLDIAQVIEALPQLLSATRLSLFISLTAFALAIVVGLIMAAMRRSKVLPVRVLAFIYVNLFRGAALYVLVIWLFNGVAVATGLLIPAVTVGILALLLLNSAYLAEVFRSSIDAVDRGQWEAARAIGLSRWDVFRRVVAPQAARVAIPATGNHLIDALKDSAILAVIAVPELMFVSNRIAQSTFRPFEMYVAAAAIYLVLVYTIAGLLRLLERSLDVERREPIGGLAPR